MSRKSNRSRQQGLQQEQPPPPQQPPLQPPLQPPQPGLQNGGPQWRKPALPKSLMLKTDATRNDFRIWKENYTSYCRRDGLNMLENLEWTLPGKELADVNRLLLDEPLMEPLPL